MASQGSSGWRTPLQRHPKTGIALLIALLALMVMLAQSLLLVALGEASTFLRYGLLGGLAGFAATALGALPGLVLRGLPQQIEDSMLGFAAGMMLAASSFSLIIPGVSAAKTMVSSPIIASLIVVVGMALGVMLMLGLDRLIPHQHQEGELMGVSPERYSGVWLFVFAIALHNLPEGMAIGVSFAQGELSVGIPLTTAIALQDIPEGLAVVLALRAINIRPWSGVLIAIFSGLFEPIGALIGVTLSSGFALAYPVGLGLAAGAMLFVVSHEVIPQTHRNGHQTYATLGLMAGFCLMMTLDTALG